MIPEPPLHPANAAKPSRSNAIRQTLFTLLYFSEGAPIGFIWWALPTLLRTRGVALERITTLTSILILPWVGKFLWSPLVDTWRTPRWGFRAWIISAQLLMGVTLLPLIWFDPIEHFSLWFVLLLCHALAAATQDVAIDALAINVVPESQRGLLNGSMQAGMLLGRSLFGGGALLVATRLGWHWIFIGLILCLWSATAVLLFVREPEVLSEKKSWHEFRSHLLSALRQRTTWLGLAFALTSAAAFEATGALAGPYLIDRNVARETVGFFFTLPVVVATISGGLVGGRLSDYLGRMKAVGHFLLGFVLVIVGLGLAEMGTPPTQAILLSLLAALYFFIGLFTAASYALFMDLTDPKLGGTQFSTFMAATNGCESWSGWAGGQLAARGGYALSFLAMSAVSLLSLRLLQMLARVAGQKTLDFRGQAKQ
jgi:MFS transporter, PAT family, beta-lactamase induction signal transducer AmpG